MAALALLTFSTSVIQTAVAPALPAIQRDLGASTTGVTWVLTVTGLLFAVATPIVGRLGDMFGRHRTLTFVVAATCLGCLVSAVSHSLGLLIAGRALQGMGGSSFALAFAVARDEVPSERRSTAFGIISATYGVGGVAGYPLAGVIVDHLSYEWIFWFGIVAVGASGLAARLVMPPSPVRSPAPIDWVGAVLFAAGVASGLVGASEGVHWGWASAPVLALFAGGALLLGCWALWELRVDVPVFDLGLLRRRGIWTVNAFGVAMTFGLFAVILLVPKLVETPHSLGYGFGVGVTGASYFLMPMAVVMLVASPVGGVLAGRIGAKQIAVVGAAAAAVAFAGLAAFHDTAWQIGLCTALVGLGMGFNLTSAVSLLAVAAPQAQVGEATGMTSMLRAGGGAVGSQVAATVVSTSVVAGTSFPAERGYTIAFAIAACAALVSLVAALLVPGTATAAPASLFAGTTP